MAAAPGPMGDWLVRRPEVEMPEAPSPTLGDVFEAVASETDDAAEVVAVLARVFGTRKIRWARPRPGGLDPWAEDWRDP